MISCLFGAYFNQDWDEGYDGTPEGVINGFAYDATENEIKITINELLILMKKKHTKVGWYQLISDSFSWSYSLRLDNIEPILWMEIGLWQIENNLLFTINT